MALVSDGAFIEDEWRRLADEESLPRLGQGDRLARRVCRQRSPMRGSRAVGVYVANTTDPTSARAAFCRVSRSSTSPFPPSPTGAASRSRGSCAAPGFAGELRASGRLTPDQYLHAIGCGFDSIEIPDDLAARQDEANWATARQARSLSYQRGYAGRRVHSRRAAKGASHEAVDRRNPRAARSPRSISIIA